MPEIARARRIPLDDRNLIGDWAGTGAASDARTPRGKDRPQPMADRYAAGAGAAATTAILTAQFAAARAIVRRLGIDALPTVGSTADAFTQPTQRKTDLWSRRPPPREDSHAVRTPLTRRTGKTRSSEINAKKRSYPHELRARLPDTVRTGARGAPRRGVGRHACAHREGASGVARIPRKHRHGGAHHLLGRRRRPSRPCKAARARRKRERERVRAKGKS